MAVEGRRQPFDGADKHDMPGYGTTVGTDQVDFRVELPVPPGPYRLDLAPGQRHAGGGQLQGLAHERLDRPATPSGPPALNETKGCLGPSPAGLLLGTAKDRQVKTQIAVSYAVESGLARPGRHRLVDGQDPLLLDQAAQQRRQRT